MGCEVNTEEREVIVVVIRDYPLGRAVVKERKFCFLCRFGDEYLVVF